MPRLGKKCCLFTFLVIAFLIVLKKYILNSGGFSLDLLSNDDVESDFEIDPNARYLKDTHDHLMWFVQVSLYNSKFFVLAIAKLK